MLSKLWNALRIGKTNGQTNQARKQVNQVITGSTKRYCLASVYARYRKWLTIACLGALLPLTTISISAAQETANTPVLQSLPQTVKQDALTVTGEVPSGVDANTTVNLYQNGNLTENTRPNVDGSFNVDTELSTGNNTFTATTLNADSGQESPQSAEQTVNYIPLPDLDSPLLHVGETDTQNPIYAVTGQAEPSQSIIIYHEGVATTQVSADNTGFFSADITLRNDANAIHATALQAGNETSASNTLVVTLHIPNNVPTPPQIAHPNNNSPNNGNTADTTAVIEVNDYYYTFNGQSEPNQTITIYANGIEVGTTATDSTGFFTASVLLEQTDNIIYTTALSNGIESLPSNALLVQLADYSSNREADSDSGKPEDESNTQSLFNPVTSEISNPIDASTITGADITFDWNYVPDAAEYFLWLGTSVGGYDIYNASHGLDLTSGVIADYNVSSTNPTTYHLADGDTLYVRLFTSQLGGGSPYIDYTYTYSTSGSSLTSPTLNSSSSTVYYPSYGFTGNTEPNADVRIYLNGTEATTVTANSAGEFIAGVTLDIIGVNTIYATQFDGNDESGPSNALTVTYSEPGGQPPTADAGPDQSKDEGSEVTLNGQGSIDYDDGIAEFAWSQLPGSPGPAITLTAANSSLPKFTAPEVTEDTDYAFELTVTDAGGLTDTDQVTITIIDTTVIPITANIVSPLPANPLTGSTVTFTWENVQGANYYFIVRTDNETYFDEFLQPDTGTTTSRTVTGLPTDGSTIKVILGTLIGGQFTSINYDYTAASNNSNDPIIVDAGADQIVGENIEAFLTGSAIPTIGNTIDTYTWTQRSGPPVNIVTSVPNSGNAQFTTPEVTSPITLAFDLTVTDIQGNIASDRVKYNVKDPSYVPNYASILTPASGSTIYGTSIDFTWEDVFRPTDAGPNSYFLLIGTAPTNYDIYSGTQAQNTSFTLLEGNTQYYNLLPMDGSTIYVTLYTRKNGQWNPVQVEYISRALINLDAPVLDTPAPNTNSNPLPITGTTTANANVQLYVNNTPQPIVTADLSGIFTVPAALYDGTNTIYATTVDGNGNESDQSVPVTTNYTNILSQNQSGTLTQDTVWTAGNPSQPYTITGDIIVPINTTLTLQPGVQLLFQSTFKIQVEGSLIIQGTEINPVTLTSANTTPSPNDWRGVLVKGTGQATIDHAIIEYGSDGINVEAGGELTLTNSWIRYNDNAGIYLSDATATIQGNEIKDNGRYGIYIYETSNAAVSDILINGENEITGNNKYNSTGNGYGIYVYKRSSDVPLITVNRNSIYDNAFGSYLNNGRDFYLSIYSSNYWPLGSVIDAQENWWGTTAVAEISARSIYDYSNNTNLATIDYRNYLNDVTPGGQIYTDSNGSTQIQGGALIGNTTIAGNTNYQTLGNITVPSGSVLTIEAGANIAIGGNYEIRVEGTLNIVGTMSNPVSITSGQSTPAADDWQEIIVTNGGQANIDHAIIEYGSDGINVEAGGELTLTNSWIRYNNNAGIFLSDATATIQGNEIKDNGRYGIYIYETSNAAVSDILINGENEITGNNKYNSTGNGYGIYVYKRSSDVPLITVNRNSIYDNAFGSYLNNGRDFYLYAQGVANAWPVGTPDSIINAQENWWGTTAVAEISARSIYDYSNNINLATIDYRNYLTDHPSNGGIVFTDGTTQVLPGAIPDGTTFTSGTTYTLLGDILVPANTTLTVEAGATIVMEGPYEINVEGTLDVQGTSTNPAIFTSGQDTPAHSDWAGIEIMTGGTLALDYAEVSYANDGILVNADSTVDITNSTIQYNDDGINVAAGGEITLSNNQLQYNNNAGIFLSDATATIQGNEIKDNGRYGIYIYETSNAAVSDILINGENEITGNNKYNSTGNGYGIYVYKRSSDVPLITVNRNSIYDNAFGSYLNNGRDFYLYAQGVANAWPVGTPDSIINAQENWWGTTAVAEISARSIYDYSNNINLATIDYRNYLTDHPSNGGIVFTDGTTQVLPGAIPDGTTFTSGTTYTLLGDILVPANTTLTVEAGATIVMEGPYEINVEGTLDVQGTSTNPAIFTSGQDTPAHSDWAGIEIMTGGTLALDYAEVSYANDGILVNADSTVDITNSTIQYNDDGINVAAGGEITLSNNQLQYNNNAGIFLSDATATIQGNEIKDNGRYGIYIYETNNAAVSDILINGENEIIGNNKYNSTGNGYGIYARKYSTDIPTITVNRNSIYDNAFGSYLNYGRDFYLSVQGVANAWPVGTPDSIINAQENWWGTTAVAEISARSIYDYSNNINLATIDYRNYLTDHPSNGGIVFTDGTTQVLPGAIPDGTTFTSGTTYALLGDILVPANTTLTVESGATVIMEGPYEIRVEGTLDVQGTETNPAIFTSGQDFPAKDDWQGIIIAANGILNLDHAIIQYADKGIEFLEQSIGTITNSLIQHNIYGIYIRPETSPNINGNTIVYNTYGIYVQGSNNDSTNPQPIITGNDIYGNSSYELYVTAFGTGSAIVLDATGNWWGTATPEVGGGKEIYLQSSAATVVDYSGYATAPLNGTTLSAGSFTEVYFSPNSDGIKETTTFNGALSGTAAWIVNVKNQAGSTVRTYTGSGNTISITWDGRNTSGSVVPDGRYTFSVTTTSGGNTLQAGQVPVFTDTVSPIAEITNPIAASTIENTLTLSVTGDAYDALTFSDYVLEYGAGTSPTSWIQINAGSTVIEDNVLGNWVLATQNDSVPPIPNGQYTLRLTANDQAGNSQSQSIGITINNLTITDVSRANSTIDPLAGDVANIQFTINQPADVTLKIYRQIDAQLLNDYSDPVYENTANYATADTHSIAWNGTDSAGSIVPDEAYLYVLSAISGGLSFDYIDADNNGFVGPPAVVASSTSYDPYANEDYMLEMNTSFNGRFKLRITLRRPDGSNYFYYPQTEFGKPLEIGIHTLRWDGRDETGAIYTGTTPSFWVPDMTELNDNYILVNTTASRPIITGPAPSIEVKSDPYLIYLSYGQFSKFRYNLDRPATVSITMLPPGITDVTDPTAIDVITNQSQAVGDHEVEWTGVDSTDASGKTRLTESDGSYTFVIKAIGPNGASSETKGVLTSYQ